MNFVRYRANNEQIESYSFKQSERIQIFTIFDSVFDKSAKY